MGNDQADRTLFVGNLHTKVTEELLFELFLQAGPTVNVKIPKDKDGKSKMFAFINFKHEESVTYGMNLLNGIKIYGRPLKIQYRSGSTHVSQDANPAAQSPQGNGQSPNGSRQDMNEDLMKYGDHSPVPNYQRSYSSPDNLQRQAMMNNYYKQEQQMGQPSPPLSSYSPNSGWSSSSSNHPTPHRYESTPGQRNSRNHPYKNENYHNREMYNKAGQEEHYYRSHGQEEQRYRSHGQEAHRSHGQEAHRSHGQETHNYRSHGQERSSPNPRNDSRWGSPYH